MLALFTKLREKHPKESETLDSAISAAKTDSFSEELIDRLVALLRSNELAIDDKKQLSAYIDELIYLTHEKYNDEADLVEPLEEDDSEESTDAE
jgi:hypothetical protein